MSETVVTLWFRTDVRLQWGSLDLSNKREPRMSGKSILTAAIVSLVVVIAYDQYKARKG
jgi:hypothetical protein